MRSLLLPFAFLVVFGSAAPALWAQQRPDRLELLEGDSIELTPPVQQSLVQLQEEWQQWVNGFYTVERERFEERVERMIVEVRRLGMRRLPELSRAAAAQALASARQGDPERAGWALDAAENLDPGRPETAFRRAQVAALEGDWGLAGTGWIEGHLRLARHSGGRTPLSIALCIAYALLLAAALWMALRMIVRGPGLFAALERPLTARMPTGLARVLAALLLVWPIVLPPGLLWLLVYWSILLWGFGSQSERVVTVLLWSVVAVLPSLIVLGSHSTSQLRSPAHRALESLAEDRLYGRLFVDLEEVVERFPEEPAVVHLLADLHRELQQWDVARRYYQRLLEVEPDNASALIDLGAYYYYNNDYGTAVRYFRRATEAEPDHVGAWFDLSQAYNDSFLLDEMQQAFQRAQELGDDLVAHYQGVSEEARVVTFEGGYERIPELIDRLPAHPSESQEAASDATPAPWWLLLVVPGWLVLALGVGRFLQGPSGPVLHGLALREGGAARMLRVLVPGWVSLEDGLGGRALAALTVPVLLLTLPAVSRIGFPLPPGAGEGELLALAVAGLIVYFGLRLWWDVSHGH